MHNTKSNELIIFLRFRELDMDTQLIIQMNGKTTGILNSKVTGTSCHTFIIHFYF
jgi:hypothetical protein